MVLLSYRIIHWTQSSSVSTIIGMTHHLPTFSDRIHGSNTGASHLIIEIKVNESWDALGELSHLSHCFGRTRLTAVEETQLHGIKEATLWARVSSCGTWNRTRCELLRSLSLRNTRRKIQTCTGRCLKYCQKCEKPQNRSSNDNLIWLKKKKKKSFSIWDFGLSTTSNHDMS